jgi:hypothetical protein
MATTVTKKSAISTDVFMPKLTLTLTFGNGQEIIVNANDLRQDIRDMAMMAGLKAKLIDAAAMSRNPENGASASVDDKYNAVKRVADRLMSDDGQWNEGRSAAGDGTAGANNILLRAIMRMTGKDETYCRDFLSAKTKEQRAALRKNPRVLQIMAELQAATVVGGINTDALLAELGVDDGNADADTDESEANNEQTDEDAPDLTAEVVRKPASKRSARSKKPKLVTTEA